MQPITDLEFHKLAKLLYESVGIHLSEKKKIMLTTRLQRRLHHYHLDSFAEYYKLIQSGEHPGELQVMIDHLATNETYFFREPEHFKFLANALREQSANACRIWCAACSSGEEVYTLAMILEDVLGSGRWSILGSDISSRVLVQARQGIYPESENHSIPEYYLKRYCLQGTGKQAGNFTVDRRLKDPVEFRPINLVEPLPSIGSFDYIFIRNVMIYFDQKTKVQVVKRVIDLLRPGGYIVTSHSETLHGISDQLRMVRPSIYQKAAR